MRLTKLARILVASSVLGCISFPAAALAGSTDWSGFYAGVNIGGGTGSTDWSGIKVPGNSGQNYNQTFSTSHPAGVLGGVQAGYNFQIAPMYVLGVEGGVSAAGLHDGNECFGSPSYGDYSANCHTKVDFMADLAVRFGFTPMDRLLIYGKAGGTYAHADFQPRDESGPYGSTGGYKSSSDDRFGYLLGVGAEYALTKKWLLGFEYDYRDFGKDRVGFTPNSPKNSYNPAFSADTSLKLHTFVARLSYRF